MFSAPFLVTLLDRVKAVVRRVARPVAERARSGPGAVLASAREPISPVLRGIAQGWMSAKLRALSALMRRIEAGETLGAAVRAPSVSNVLDARPMQQAIPPEERLPRGFGWMCAFGPNVRGDGAAFAELLNEPWMRAKVLAAPERMAGLIGPLLNATGARRPEWFPVAPRKAKRVSDTSVQGADSGPDGAASHGAHRPGAAHADIGESQISTLPAARPTPVAVRRSLVQGAKFAPPAGRPWSGVSSRCGRLTGPVSKIRELDAAPLHAHIVAISYRTALPSLFLIRVLLSRPRIFQSGSGFRGFPSVRQVASALFAKRGPFACPRINSRASVRIAEASRGIGS